MIEIQEDNIELVKILNNEAVVGNNQKKVQELIEYKLQIIKRTTSDQITWKKIYNLLVLSICRYYNVCFIILIIFQHMTLNIT